MSRLIDADALIARLEDDAKHMEDPLAIMFTYGAINDIKHEPTVVVPQWIPVTERLPEKSNDYLCSYGALTGHFVGIDIYDADKKEFGFYSDDEQGNEVWHPVKNVVAWMSLPEPWRA